MEALVGSGRQLQGSVSSGDALGALGRPWELQGALQSSAELCELWGDPRSPGKVLGAL